MATKAQSQFDQVMATIPSRANFEITMDGDSTNEVWTDVDTNLQDGEAWLVYGAEFSFEFIDPTIPHHIFQNDEEQCYCLQVHRNDDSAILLNFNDDDLMFEWRYGRTNDVQTAVGFSETEWYGPFRFGHRTITMSEQLRVLFRTAVDDVDLSVATVQIAGRILYDRISAPSIGASKLGNIANL